MLLTFFICLHVIISIALIFIVLIQTGKGGLDSNFGGVATNMFGVQGANEFVKLWTKILFAAFVISCVLMAYTVKKSGGTRSSKSALQEDIMNETSQTSDISNPFLNENIENIDGTDVINNEGANVIQINSEDFQINLD
jgi:preprotein translocase subunit SecG